MIYTLTLNPALDYDIYLDKLNLSELNIAKNINYRPGGKGINVSIILKNLGQDSIATGFLSGFTGKYIENELNNMKIKNDFIQTDGITRINVKLNDKNEETEIAGLSNIINHDDLENLFTKLSNLSSEDILILSGSIPKNLEEDIYKKISLKTKAKVALDTRGNLLLKNICNNIVIKPNIKELEEVFNKKLNTYDEIFNSCQHFIEKGVSKVLVSMGSKGAMLVLKDRYFYSNVPNGKYINSIGSGDSMLGAYIYGYINNYNNIDSLKLAIAAGSATAYSYGIGNKELIDKLINQITITEVKNEFKKSFY